MAADFADRFCSSTGVTPERWRAVALRCTLYPHARMLRPLLSLCDADFFAADQDFLHGVGRLTQRDDFKIEAEDFAHHPANRGFLRRVLRLRVSVRRTRTLVMAVFAGLADGRGDHLGAPRRVRRS